MKRVAMLAASAILGITFLGGCEEDTSKETTKTNEESITQEAQVDSKGENTAGSSVTNENSESQATVPSSASIQDGKKTTSTKTVSEYETDEALFSKKELKQLPTVREAAYEHLGYSDASSLTADYKNGKVTIAKVIDIPELLISESELDVTDVYHVVFPTVDDSVLGPIEIYVHPYTFEVIGQGVRN